MGTARGRDPLRGGLCCPGDPMSPWHPWVLHGGSTHCDGSSGHFSCSMSLRGGEEVPVDTREDVRRGETPLDGL